MPLEVSVVIPTYNRAHLLPHTLASILAQSHKAVEIIVVDDGSTDATEALARSFQPPVKYIRIQNSGVCTARNIGASVANAPWIAFCDSDDLWHPDKLALQVQLLQAIPQLEYAFTNFRVVSDDVWSTETKFDRAPPDYWEAPKRHVTSDSFVIDTPIFAKLLRFQPIFPSTIIMTQEFFRRVGRWAEELDRVLAEDFEFHLRCVMYPPIGVVLAPVVGIRKHPGNISGDALRMYAGEIEILRYVLQNHHAARRHEDDVRAAIVDRRIAAAELAFWAGHLDVVREMMGPVPWLRRSWRLHMKNVIAHLPGPLSRFLQRGALTIAGQLRHYTR